MRSDSASLRALFIGHQNQMLIVVYQVKATLGGSFRGKRVVRLMSAVRE
jgi:hypothetical protein